MLTAIMAALTLAGQQGAVVNALQPTRVAELWTDAGGEYTVAPERTDPNQIVFGLWIGDVDVEVRASDCAPDDGPADVVCCQRFFLQARELYRQVDLRQGVTTDQLEDVLSDLMEQVRLTYPILPPRP